VDRDAQETSPVGYGIMMDAGSTGTRVHVYRWFWPKGERMPNVTDDHFYEVKPGLSSYKTNPDLGAKSVSELLDFAYSVVRI